MENIIIIAVGILLLVLGYLIAFHQKINLVHSYHYKRVADKDRPVFCKGIGYGNLLVGAGLIIFPVLNFFCGEVVALIGVGIFIVAGLFVALYTIIKYNKGLF